MKERKKEKKVFIDIEDFEIIMKRKSLSAIREEIKKCIYIKKQSKRKT